MNDKLQALAPALRHEEVARQAIICLLNQAVG